MSIFCFLLQTVVSEIQAVFGFGQVRMENVIFNTEVPGTILILDHHSWGQQSLPEGSLKQQKSSTSLSSAYSFTSWFPHLACYLILFLNLRKSLSSLPQSICLGVGTNNVPLLSRLIVAVVRSALEKFIGA